MAFGVSPRRDHDDRRGSAHSRGYTSAWQKARDAFLRENPLCAMHRERGQHVAARVVDHIKAPRLRDALDSKDDERIAAARSLFWDRANWQPLCKLCHDSVKQRLEKSGRLSGCDASGRPIDPRHHWRTQAPGEGG